MTIEITRELAQRVDNVVSQGLVSGLGEPKPGQMCVEAAVCFALGLPHGDDPECVGSAVRRFKIRLNDSRWSSDEARTKGLRKLAIAQLGSNLISQVEFSKFVSLAVIREILPVVLRQYGIEKEAAVCESAANLSEGGKAAMSAYAAAYAAAYTAADAAAADAAYAAYAAYAAADAAYTAADAAAAAAAAAADAAVRWAGADADSILNLTSEICLRALIELKSPGVAWLNIIPDSEG